MSQQKMLTTVEIQQASGQGGGDMPWLPLVRTALPSAPAPRPPQLLEENTRLIQVINENQNLGKLEECTQ